jgi:hypothetical protein
MKRTILMTIASLALVGSGLARTWSNADGSKTFEGEFVLCDGTSVTVKRGIKEMTFKLTLLSEDDQKWAKAEGEKVATSVENKKTTEDFSKSKFGKAFKRLQKFEDTKFVSHELEEAPKFFLLYFSASW